MTYENASYGTGGVALRNRGSGVLNVSGVTGPVQDAYLYWAIIFNTATPADTLSHVTLRRISFPLLDWSEVSLKGTLLGIAVNPLWGVPIFPWPPTKGGVAVFRARVPKWIATGNGAYEVILPRGASGLTDGSDPWVSSVVFPLAEGASLVIVGTGNYTVGIYDAGLTATMFGCGPPFSSYTYEYLLTLPAAFTADALWDNIGADGQAAGFEPSVPQTGRRDSPEVSLETTSINSVLIAGAGGLDNDSDWNGSAGLPIPQLWDDTGHDISLAFTGPPYPTTADILFTGNGDCVVTVANVLAVQ
jgi:hypothetical protein